MAVPGTFNFRDVGGLPADTGTVRSGVLFRSDGLHRLGEAGRAALRELGVGVVIDLRDTNETTIMPDDLDGLDVEVKSLPVFEGSGASQSMVGVRLDDLYERIVGQHSGVIIEVLRDVIAAGSRAEGSRASVVHCTAGKDRTGVVVAFALLAVGTNRDAVVENYSESEQNLAGEWLDHMVQMATQYGVPDTPELRTLMGGSPSAAIEAAIDQAERDHGSVREYLLAAGLELSELAELERILIEK